MAVTSQTAYHCCLVRAKDDGSSFDVSITSAAWLNNSKASETSDLHSASANVEKRNSRNLWRPKRNLSKKYKHAKFEKQPKKHRLLFLSIRTANDVTGVHSVLRFGRDREKPGDAACRQQFLLNARHYPQKEKIRRYRVCHAYEKE